MDASKAWRAVLGQLQVEMSKATYDTWVKEAEFVAYEDGTFVIGVSNAYARDWLESRLKSTTTRILTGMMKRTVEVRFAVWGNDAPREQVLEQREDEPETLPAPDGNPSLNTRYQFDNFVVGPSNRLAHAAAMAVAEQPGQAYNPLFLYGRVGLGKTHLLQAIGNTAHAQGLDVLYVSSEEFTNDLIQAIRSHSTENFREQYRQPDLLLIDDIQFIIGKESTQEEFFHTFNTLHGRDKQIVITCDRSPKALADLEERLRSRFAWGLIADVHSPNVEMRQAILRSKAESLGYDIEEDVLQAVAEQMKSNVRELEGALTRIVAYAKLHGLVLDRALVEEALNDLIPSAQEPEPDHILAAVAQAYNLSEESLLGRSRSRKVALPRQVAMYLMRETTQLSLPQIGDALGGRDHTTVMYGCDKITELIEEDRHLREKIAQLSRQLTGQALPVFQLSGS